MNVLVIFYFSSDCYIAKYRNCDQIKLLVGNVRVIHPQLIRFTSGPVKNKITHKVIHAEASLMFS